MKYITTNNGKDSYFITRTINGEKVHVLQYYNEGTKKYPVKEVLLTSQEYDDICSVFGTIA